MFDNGEMLASQRQERILADVLRQGAVRIADLTRELGVSDMTIRRDLADLATQGLVRKVHGGAVAPQTTAHEPRFAVKQLREAPEKQRIAQAAAALVTPGSAIALSAGTTTHLLAATLAASPTLRPLTVVTNSLPVAETLYRAEDPRVETVLCGGSRTPSDALVGPLAEAALAGLRVDTAFVGAHGVDPAVGLTTPNLDEAATNRAMIHSAGRTVVLADHTKWHTTGLSVFATFADIDVLVTDDGLPQRQRDLLRNLVGELILC